MRINIHDIDLSNIQKIMHIIEKLEAITSLTDEDKEHLETLLRSNGEDRVFKTKGLAVSYTSFEDTKSANMKIDIDDALIGDMIDIVDEIVDWTVPFLPMIKKAIRGISTKVLEITQKWTIPDDEKRYALLHTHIGTQWFSAIVCQTEYGTKVISIMDTDWKQSDKNGKLKTKYAMITAEEELANPGRTLQWFTSIDEAVQYHMNN